MRIAWCQARHTIPRRSQLRAAWSKGRSSPASRAKAERKSRTTTQQSLNTSNLLEHTVLDTMPPTTASQKPGPKLSAAPAAASNGKAAGAASAAATGDEFSGKPDQEKYNAEQDAINSEIATVKSKLVSVV